MLTVGLLTHAPSLVGYHAEALDILRLAVLSARAHAGEPVAVMVVDNGSCAEVRDWLVRSADDGTIDHLVLNARNLGKVTAVSQILLGAPTGDVVYADGDLRFLPGWVGPMTRIAGAFPRVGVVGGTPPLPVAGIVSEAGSTSAGSTDAGAPIPVDPRLADLVVRTDLTLDEQYLREMLADTGHEGARLEAALERELAGRSTLLRSPGADGVEAILGATHAQYLVTAELRGLLSPRVGHLALASAEDEDLDRHLDESGLLRLSVTSPVYRHVGNRLDAADRDELARLSAAPVAAADRRLRGRAWRRHPVRLACRWLHDASFQVSRGEAPIVRGWVR